MIIHSVELSNFRNYNRLAIDFDKDTNILYGDNAQGKTNVLEAVYLCSTTKSHKCSKDRDMIQIGETEAHIRMVIEKRQMFHTVDMHLKKHKSKGIAIDSIPIRKSSELIGFTPIVFFSPEDLSIIKNGPGERRRFIDMELCQLDKLYLHDLTNYNKIINQRNNLLKQIGLKRELLDTLNIWDEQLADYGRKIIIRRTQFIEELNQILYSIHKKLSGQKEKLEVRYAKNISAEQLLDKLNQTQERDITFKMTGIGPHRDDIIFLVENVDIRKFGSQGQQRTAALSLKLAEIELLRQTMKDSPVLLLDDVLSELDRNRQNYLLESIENIQTIITCTGLEEFVNNRIKVNQIYKVTEGTVSVENR